MKKAVIFATLTLTLTLAGCNAPCAGCQNSPCSALVDNGPGNGKEGSAGFHFYKGHYDAVHVCHADDGMILDE